MKTNIIGLRAGLFLLFVATLVGATAAPAQASEAFGQEEQVVIGGSSAVMGLWRHQRVVVPRNHTSVALTPGPGLFVAKNLLLRADLGLEAELDGLRGPLELTGSPKIGYNFDLGRGVSLLPSLGGRYQFRFGRRLGGREHVAAALVEAPFFFQLVKHGALHLGPVCSYRFTQGGGVDIGLVGGVSLWI